ncbi:MAG: hypothetical protein DMF56_17930 [Acidobacteria bacterium]|nr:MAG: hypothetical protein DMF56_17930 [Acidobacteriota bacterium]
MPDGAIEHLVAPSNISMTSSGMRFAASAMFLAASAMFLGARTMFLFVRAMFLAVSASCYKTVRRSRAMADGGVQAAIVPILTRLY